MFNPLKAAKKVGGAVAGSMGMGKGGGIAGKLARRAMPGFAQRAASKVGGAIGKTLDPGGGGVMMGMARKSMGRGKKKVAPRPGVSR